MGTTDKAVISNVHNLYMFWTTTITKIMLTSVYHNYASYKIGVQGVYDHVILMQYYEIVNNNLCRDPALQQKII